MYVSRRNWHGRVMRDFEKSKDERLGIPDRRRTDIGGN